MSLPLVSVLLPARNADETLPAALQSLTDQTFQDWEAWLVDDGSTDATGAVMRAWAEQDARFKVFSQPPLGLVAALNAAVAQAKGSLIARMDADDLCAPLRFEKQVAALNADKALGLIACQVNFGGNRETHPGYAHHVDWLNGLISPEEHRLNRFVESPVAHPSVMWRREISDRLGAYREGDFPEDYELWLRWLDQGVKMAKVPEPLLTWNDSPERLSRTDARYRTAAFYELKCHYLAGVLPADRPLWLWGSGRSTRRRFDRLEALCGPFAGFVDVDPRKVGRRLQGRPVISPDALPSEALVLAGVGVRGARERIAARLHASGRRAGSDFWLCA